METYEQQVEAALKGRDALTLSDWALAKMREAVWEDGEEDESYERWNDVHEAPIICTAEGNGDGNIRVVVTERIRFGGEYSVEIAIDLQAEGLLQADMRGLHDAIALADTLANKVLR